MIDTIPEFVWSALPDGGVEFCNQNWLGYTGMALDEIKGWGWAAAIHPQDIRDLQERWRAALKQGTSLEAEARMRSVDGSSRWFLIRAVPLRDDQGRIIRWYGTNTDIEDLKRAQEELHKQTRLDELFEQAPEAAAVLSTDDRIVRVNKEFTRMFGYEAEEILQRPINDLIVPKALVESAREYTNQLKHGGRVEVESVRRRKDGSDIRVSGFGRADCELRHIP